MRHLAIIAPKAALSFLHCLHYQKLPLGLQRFKYAVIQRQESQIIAQQQYQMCDFSSFLSSILFSKMSYRSLNLLGYPDPKDGNHQKENIHAEHEGNKQKTTHRVAWLQLRLQASQGETEGIIDCCHLG